MNVCLVVSCRVKFKMSLCFACLRGFWNVFVYLLIGEKQLRPKILEWSCGAWELSQFDEKLSPFDLPKSKPYISKQIQIYFFLSVNAIRQRMTWFPKMKGEETWFFDEFNFILWGVIYKPYHYRHLSAFQFQKRKGSKKKVELVWWLHLSNGNPSLFKYVSF